VLVEQTRVAMEDTDDKVNELLVLLRNQAAASGLNLDIESESAIRNAVRAIVVSSNARKQAALDHLQRGDVSAAASLMEDIARSQAEAVSDTVDAAADTWREAGALFNSFDIPRAVNSYREATRLQPNHALSWDLLGHALVRSGDLDDAAAAFNRVLLLDSTEIERSSANAGLGIIHKQRGRYADAESHYRTALDLANGRKTSEEYMIALASIGQLELARGNFDEASALLQSALELADESGNARVRASILGALGTVLARQGRYDDAEHFQKEALAIHEADDDLANRTNTLGNLGAVSLSRGEIDAAEARILESARLSEQLGWRTSLAYDLVNLAGISAERKDFATANDRISRAEEIAMDVGLAELLPVITFNRGEFARDSGDIDLACDHWSAAIPAMIAADSMHLAFAEEEFEKAGCTAPGDANEP